MYKEVRKMVLGRLTPAQLIEIWRPRYKDRKVLIATYKVGTHNSITFTRAKHLLGQQFYASGEKIKSYPTESNGKITCYAVPMEILEPLERI